MQRPKQRKIPVFTFLALLIIGGIFSIKVFTSADKPQPSPLWETQTLSDLTSQFTTSKLWTLHIPEIIIPSELNGTINHIKIATGDKVKGGQPLLTLNDEFWWYTSQLEIANSLLTSTQQLYDTTQTNFSEQIKNAESSIADLQHQLKQTEQDLQSILNQQITAPTEPHTEDTLDTDYQSSQLLKQALLQSLTTTEQRLEQAKLNYEILKTTQSSQLTTLQQSLQTTRKDYENAYTTYNKLSIRAPLAGTIKQFFVEPWEPVQEGTPLISFIPDNHTSTIQVPLTFAEYITVLNISGVEIVSYDSSLHHVETITRSPIANESGMYTLSIESPIKETEWKQLEVQFPIQTDFYYLPKKSIEIQNQTSGYVYLLIHNQLQKLPIELWNQRNDYIEVKTPLNAATQIITNRTSVF